MARSRGPRRLAVNGRNRQPQWPIELHTLAISRSCTAIPFIAVCTNGRVKYVDFCRPLRHAVRSSLRRCREAACTCGLPSRAFQSSLCPGAACTCQRTAMCRRETIKLLSWHNALAVFIGALHWVHTRLVLICTARSATEYELLLAGAHSSAPSPSPSPSRLRLRCGTTGNRCALIA